MIQNALLLLNKQEYDPLSKTGDFQVVCRDNVVTVVWYTNQPAQAEIDAAIIPAAKSNAKATINTEATRRILSVYTLEKQSSANMGLYPQTYLDQMVNDIAAVIQASNDACDLVDAAVDEAGINAVVPNWPVIGG